MAIMSNYLSGKLLDHITGVASYSMPTAYIALSTTTITATSTGATIGEPAGGYARVATTGATWTAGSNTANIIFPQATANWGSITYMALCDSPTKGAGNILVYAPLSSSRNVNLGDQMTFTAATINIGVG